MEKRIKQILPIPESLTALTRRETSDGHKYYVDAIAGCETILYALINVDGIDGVEFYSADYYGIGELVGDDPTYVIMAQTAYCKKCGKRMVASTTPNAPERVRYRCICGERLDRKDLCLWEDFD